MTAEVFLLSRLKVDDVARAASRASQNVEESFILKLVLTSKFC